VADRAAEFLKESHNPKAEMRWAERRLADAGLCSPNQDLKPPQEWAEEVIAQNPAVEEESLPWFREHNSHPERAETFESLILSLIPTQGGL
jgi:hypothetical protein